VLLLEIISGTMTTGSYRFDGKLYKLIAYVSTIYSLLDINRIVLIITLSIIQGYHIYIYVRQRHISTLHAFVLTS
jgi:hypothetical protein